jgi:hypothetical protein
MLPSQTLHMLTRAVYDKYRLSNPMRGLLSQRDFEHQRSCAIITAFQSRPRVRRDPAHGLRYSYRTLVRFLFLPSLSPRPIFIKDLALTLTLV